MNIEKKEKKKKDVFLVYLKALNFNHRNPRCLFVKNKKQAKLIGDLNHPSENAMITGCTAGWGLMST